MAENRVDPYIEGREHEKTYENVYFASIARMIELLEAFARTHLSKWKKEHESISPDGRTFTSQYSATERMTWILRPRSVWGHIQSGLQAGGGGDLAARASIPYELACELTLQADRPHRVSLKMRVHEHIDPHNSVTEYPIGHTFVAPSYLYQDGFVGDKLDPFLTSQLIPK